MKEPTWMPATDEDFRMCDGFGASAVDRVTTELRHQRAQVTLCQSRATAERELRMEAEQKMNAALLERDAVRDMLVKLLLAERTPPVNTRPAHVILAERRVHDAQAAGCEPATEDLQTLLEERTTAGR